MCGFEDRVRENGHAMERGELTPAETGELRAHLETCASCREELRRQQSLCALVRDRTPEVKISDAVWERIERRTAGPSVFSFFVRAAAVVLLGLGGFWLWSSLHTPSTDDPVAIVYVSDEGRPVRTGEAITVPQYATVTLPGIGALRVREHTEFVFRHARRLELRSGEIYADVKPGPEGFAIVAGPHSVDVVGTRFGVRWNPLEGRANVYVLEGTVRCAGPGGARTVSADEAAILMPTETSSRALRHDLGTYVDWLQQHDPAALVMTIDRMQFANGAAEFALSIRSQSHLPVYVAVPDLVHSYFFMSVKDPEGKEFGVRLDRETTREMSMPGGRDGLLRLDPYGAWNVSGRIPSTVFPRAGTYTVTAQLHGKKDGVSGVWHGTLESSPVTLKKD